MNCIHLQWFETESGVIKKIYATVTTKLEDINYKNYICLV